VSRFLATAAFLLLAGCGYVGAPLPPALNLPQPIADLRVTEIGESIIVRFTPPVLTTENLPVEEFREITLYVGPGGDLTAPERYKIAVTRNELELPAARWAGQPLRFAVRTTGRTGRESDWSNFVDLSVGAPLAIPSELKVDNARDAVALKWNGNAPRYRILRSVLSDPTPKLETLAEVDAAEFLDQTAVVGARYEYVILGIAGENQQSLPSRPTQFAPADVFAPAKPTGLSVVMGALAWTRNVEDDLEAYNVFRAVDDGPFELIAPGVPLPAYNDTRIEAGKRYRYAVSAVDKTGNESERSDSVE